MGLPYYRTQIRWRETARGKVIVIYKVLYFYILLYYYIVQEEGFTQPQLLLIGKVKGQQLQLKETSLSRSNSTAYSSYF